jgi:hypothetical protein
MTEEAKAEPAASPADSDPQDDLRDKFRAALERKHDKHALGGEDHASGGSKASDRTSSSKRQREFRRKSGG